jgi:CO/xanthine dehydrogenase Mo-binding subunit
MPSGSAAASRCTYVFGNALIIAANELKRRMLDAASSYFVETDTATLELLQGKIMHRKTQKTITFSDLAQQMDPTERIAEGYFKIPVTGEGKGVIYMGPHCIYSYGAHLVYIEIDELTGKVEVNKYLAASDAGKMINPQVYEQQIQGGIAQGMGYALMEDFIVEGGHIKTPDLATYIIPTFLDVPEMLSIPVELGEATGPFGIKGIGEISVNGPLPAIANAIADACGLRIQKAPFTAERVLGELEKKR